MSNKIYHSENLSIIYIIMDSVKQEFKVRNLASKNFLRDNNITLRTEKMRLSDITIALNDLIMNDNIQVVAVVDLENHFNLDMKILNKFKNNITMYWISQGWIENNSLGEPLISVNSERAESLNRRYDTIKELEEALDAQIARNQRIYVEKEEELAERLQYIAEKHAAEVEKKIAEIEADLTAKKKEYEEIMFYKDKTIEDIDASLSEAKASVDKEIAELTEKLVRWKEKKRRECEDTLAKNKADIENTKRSDLKSIAVEYDKIERSAKELIKNLMLYESESKARDIMETLKGFVTICNEKINDLKNELN